MYGFTAGLTGIRFDQSSTSPIESLMVERLGFPHNLGVQGVMKCKLGAERLLRIAGMRLFDNGAPVRVA